MRGRHSFMEDVLPFAAMIMVEFVEVGVTTLTKAAMNSGTNNLVYVVYHNALGAIILLLFFMIRKQRSRLPPLTFALLRRFFLLGLLGYQHLQDGEFGYHKTKQSSKIIGYHISNIGSICRGLAIRMILSPNSPHQFPYSRESNWVLGGFILLIACSLSSLWSILQTATVREYLDGIAIVLFSYLFGTIQCSFLTVIIERKPGAWVLHPGIQTKAVGFAAVFGNGFRYPVMTWCLHKKGPVYEVMFRPISIIIAVIMGIMFLDGTLYLGSVIGAIMIVVGLYTVMLGNAIEKITEVEGLDFILLC